MPNAAAIESRFMTTALSATNGARKATSSSRKESVSTTQITIGSRAPIPLERSMKPAVEPPT